MLRCLPLLFVLTGTAFGGELLPPEQPIEKVVDFYIDQRLQEEKVTPAPQVDDANLIRRLTLDLLGRIPTTAETREFVESKAPDKRVKLVERLLASPAYVRHQANLFDVMAASSDRKSGNLKEYFNKALSEGRSWDQIFREIVLANESDPKSKGAGEFIRSRVSDLDRLTNDVSVFFFGVNVSCAQCHNHPLVEDWKQDHYYGMKAFFNRTVDNGGFLAEREFGVVKIKPPKGPERPAKMMFLTSKVIDDPGMREPTKEETNKERELLEKHKKDKTAPPAPKFSPRAKLVEVALQEGDFFASNIANRLWHRFLGRGLVMPLDQMHSENPASHPELLSWLARDIAKHGYDLKRTIRGIVLSQAYSRSTKMNSSGDSDPGPHLYALGRLKPLTPLQMTTSMKIALSDPKSWDNLKPDDLEKRIQSLEQAGSGFASLLVQPSDDFQIGVSEALLFSNNDRVHREFILDGKDTLLGISKEAKDRTQACDQIVQSLFCRKAQPEEVKALSDYLEKRTDRLPEAYRQILWALITSAEFRFNY
jgi:hypothetical protein